MDYITGQALLSLERAHLTRLTLWAVASIVLGCGALLWARGREGARAGFWRHFGIQSVAWGAVDLVIVAFAARTPSTRDLAQAIALDRFLWLNIGLDIGYVMVGCTLLVIGLRAPSRGGLVGAGAAIMAQGMALALLDAQLSAYIVR